VHKLLYTKFAHWSYEDEYRLYVSLNEQENGLYFEPFSDELTLRQVIVGSESPLTRTDVICALGALASTVEQFKARPGFKSFKIVRQQDERLWA